MKKLLVPLLLSSFIVSCSGVLSDASHITSGDSYPATNAERVSILFEEPDKDFIIIGLVESHGMGIMEANQKERSINALKEEAASIGADAVIVTSSKKETVRGIDDQPAGEETILSGKAIKYK